MTISENKSGVKFLFTSANHAMYSLSTYPFPIFFKEWELDVKDITGAWDNKGDIVIGNDVWIGFEAIILSGVTVDDGALLVHEQLLQKMYRRIRLLEVFLQNRYENGFRTM